MRWRSREVVVPADVKQVGLYKNMMTQINKIASHNRQGSFETRDRYYHAVAKFSRFLVDKYRLEKFSNIRDEHIVSYVKYLQENSFSASTVKTSLSAIRFYHDKVENARNVLLDNKGLKEKHGLVLEQRRLTPSQKGWTTSEYNAILQRATPSHSLALRFARQLGLRLHEIARIQSAELEKALRERELCVVGKNGKEREIPLTRIEQLQLVKEAKMYLARGETFFSKEGVDAKQWMQSVQNFLSRNQDLSQSDRSLSIHGLRHSFAQQMYEEKIDEGLTAKQARLEVSRTLGHERDEVTKIYLSE
jgi:site-specific recombinase XerD